MKKKIFSSFSLPNNKPRLSLITNKNKTNNQNSNIDNADSPDKKLFFVVKNN